MALFETGIVKKVTPPKPPAIYKHYTIQSASLVLNVNDNVANVSVSKVVNNIPGNGTANFGTLAAVTTTSYNESPGHNYSISLSGTLTLVTTTGKTMVFDIDENGNGTLVSET